MNHLDLFSGIGGFALAAQRSGIVTRQLVEINPFCQQVLAKNFPAIPIWSDICDYHPKSGEFDLFTLGYPCQGNSRANHQGKGLEDPRSSLWFEALRCIHEGQPRFVVVENVPPTVNRNWLATVLEGLDQAGFDAEWEIVTASSVGAPHLRERLFIVAYARCYGLQGQSEIQVNARGSIAGREIVAANSDGGRSQQQSTAIAIGAGRNEFARETFSDSSCERRNGRNFQDSDQGRAVSATRSKASPVTNSDSESKSSQERGIFSITTDTARSQTDSASSQPGSLGVDDGVPAWLDGISYSGWWRENPAPIAAGIAPRSIRHRGDRIQGCGNAVSPQVAAIALRRVLQIAGGVA